MLAEGCCSACWRKAAAAHAGGVHEEIGLAPNLFMHIQRVHEGAHAAEGPRPALELLAVMEAQGVAPSPWRIWWVWCAAESDAKAAIELFASLCDKHTLPPDAIVYEANVTASGGGTAFGSLR
jgi:hypothetical protein